MGKYHMTQNKFLKSISKLGLIPKNGDNSKAIKDGKSVVFYSMGMVGAITLFLDFKKHYEEFKGDKGREIVAKYKDVISGKEKVDEATYLRIRGQVDQILSVQESDNFRSFLGEGVYLNLNNVNEKIDDRNFNFANAWTTKVVKPEDINVLVLKNKKDGTMLSSRYDVINYMMSKTPLESITKIGINGDLKDYITKYYERYASEIKKMGEEYSLEEIGIREFVDLRDKGKFKADKERQFRRHKEIDEKEEVIEEDGQAPDLK